MFALDTNTVVYFFKGRGHVAESLLAVPPREVVIPAVALYELEAMVLRADGARRRRQLDELVALIRVIPFGDARRQLLLCIVLPHQPMLPESASRFSVASPNGSCGKWSGIGIEPAAPRRSLGSADQAFAVGNCDAA